MAEKYPGFEPSSGDEEKKKKAERATNQFELPTRPLPRIEKSAGDTPLKFGEDFLRPKPLEHELFKKPEEAPAEKFERQDVKQTEPTQNVEPLRQVSAEDLRARAAQEQLDRLHMMQEQQGENIDGDEEKKKRRLLGGAAVTPREPRPEKPSATTGMEQQRGESEEKRAKESKSQEQPGQAEVVAGEIPSGTTQENQPSTDDETFR